MKTKQKIHNKELKVNATHDLVRVQVGEGGLTEVVCDVKDL